MLRFHFARLCICMRRRSDLSSPRRRRDARVWTKPASGMPKRASYWCAFKTTTNQFDSHVSRYSTNGSARRRLFLIGAPNERTFLITTGKQATQAMINLFASFRSFNCRFGSLASISRMVRANDRVVGAIPGRTLEINRSWLYPSLGLRAFVDVSDGTIRERRFYIFAKIRWYLNFPFLLVNVI